MPNSSSGSSDLGNASRTSAASGSEWPASPRAIPARRTASKRWIISSRRSTPAPTTSAPSSSLITATSTTSGERVRPGRDQGPGPRGDHADHLESASPGSVRWRLARPIPARAAQSALGRCTDDPMPSATSASTGQPSNVSTYSIIRSAESTSTRSTAPMRPGGSTRISASRILRAWSIARTTDFGPGSDCVFRG